MIASRRLSPLTPAGHFHQALIMMMHQEGLHIIMNAQAVRGRILRLKSPVMPETEPQHSDELSSRQISGGYRVAKHIGSRLRLVVMALRLKVREHLGSFPKE